MNLYKREDLLKDLKQHVAEVTFTKVNGEQRVMRCTLDTRYMPAYDEKYLEEQHQKKENQEVIAVWDLHANAWRSFRVDSVQYVQIIDGGY